MATLMKSLRSALLGFVALAALTACGGDDSRPLAPGELVDQSAQCSTRASATETCGAAGEPCISDDGPCHEPEIVLADRVSRP